MEMVDRIYVQRSFKKINPYFSGRKRPVRASAAVDADAERELAMAHTN